MSQRQRVGVLLLVGLVALAVLGLRHFRAQDRVWERLQRGGALQVAVDPSFPPFESVDAQGQLQGLDIELAYLLGQRLGVPVQFQAIAFDGLVDAVIAGKADVVISAFPYDPRLTQDVHFTPPYFEAGLLWVTPAASPLSSPDDFPSARLAVEWGSEGDAWARARDLPVQRYESPGAALQAVVQGEADVALVDAVTAALQAPPTMQLHTPPLSSNPYVLVVAPAAPRLARALDEAILALPEDAAWQALLQQTFNVLPPAPVLAD